MLTAEIKVNGALIATITAQNMGQAPGTEDRPGDFVGEWSEPRTYRCVITSFRRSALLIAGKRVPIRSLEPPRTITVTHDRRFGWQGLLHKITGEIMPTVVETVGEKGG